ncbi:putative carbohydrate esterase [Thalictrum thalictroides]|uniref:Putative carbohydrate esterase n=1 Tax=Thalictrum thalictroides TaxID=46969 RepID=A0A7J6WNM2_THATH|nr:putative carbohydrate esterase [Thalictrum thalictroides]
MAGRGGVTLTHPKKWDKFLPPECQPDPKILRFNAKLHWEQAHEPLHADIDSKKTCGVGPGLAFANSIRSQDPYIDVVGLVPCAVGGTAIKEWERGCHLYENMVKRTKESIKEGGEIKALLWYQGESDASSKHDAESYQANMERFIENVRSDLRLPSLPIIQVAITSGDGGYMEKIREVQLGMKVDNVVCVDAKGLELKDLAIAIRSSELRSDQFQHKNIFILAGQSNMAGRGGVIDDKWDGIVPPKCQSNSLVLRFNARSNWEEAREPLHADIDVNKTCGIGPGMAFANSIREIDPRIGTIGLVPCAIGGTNISEWHHGMSLYNNLVNRAKAALKQGGTIRAILWYQGESDTISRTDADSYGLNLKKLMLDLRVDLDSPMLPIIQVWCYLPLCTKV